MCSRRLALQDCRDYGCPRLQQASSSPALRSRRCCQKETSDCLTLRTSRSVAKSVGPSLEELVYLFNGGGDAVQPMARSLCVSRVECCGCCHYPPTFFHLLLIPATYRKRRAEPNAPLPDTPYPFYATVYRVAAKCRITGQEMRNAPD